MRGNSTSQIRAPLISPVARASFVLQSLAVAALIGSLETRGAPSYALLAVAILLALFGFRRAWRVAKWETERLR